jgi:hypothetical protein
MFAGGSKNTNKNFKAAINATSLGYLATDNFQNNTNIGSLNTTNGSSGIILGNNMNDKSSNSILIGKNITNSGNNCLIALTNSQSFNNSTNNYMNLMNLIYGTNSQLNFGASIVMNQGKFIKVATIRVDNELNITNPSGTTNLLTINNNTTTFNSPIIINGTFILNGNTLTGDLLQSNINITNINSNDLSALTTVVNTLSTTVSSNHNYTTSNITLLNNDLDALELIVSGHTTTLSTHIDQINSNTSNITNLTNDLDALELVVAGHTTTLSTHTTLINSNTSNITNLTTTVNSHTSTLATHTSEIEALQAAVGSLGGSTDYINIPHLSATLIDKCDELEAKYITAEEIKTIQSRIYEPTKTQWWDLYVEPKMNMQGKVIESALTFASSFGTATTSWDSTFDGGVLSFTGQHVCGYDEKQILNEDNINDLIGRVVISTGKYLNLDENEQIKMDDSIPIIELSKKNKDTCVFGVISRFEKDIHEEPNRTFKYGYMNIHQKKLSKRVVINSLGEGAIKVINTNGPIKNGDLLCSSMNGFAEKQDDDIIHSYTIAKATCDCNFDNYKIHDKNRNLIIALIGCIYLL